MIVAIDPALERGAGRPDATFLAATVLDSDDLTRLHVEAPGADDAQADAALQAAGLGYLEGEHAWLSVAALRDQGSAPSTDWPQRFDAMITYAVGKGWTSPDGSHVQAHVERTQRKADS